MKGPVPGRVHNEQMIERMRVWNCQGVSLQGGGTDARRYEVLQAQMQVAVPPGGMKRVTIRRN